VDHQQITVVVDDDDVGRRDETGRAGSVRIVVVVDSRHAR
jgi:hypothetical protein